VVIAAQWFEILHSHGGRGGDYSLSREFGRRFLYHEDLYGHGLHYPYMPSAAMYFAPLALFGFSTGLLLRYCAALVCLWLSLRMMQTMVRAANPQLAELLEGLGFQITALTVLLASHYVLRDLDDGGPHLILLAMLVAGVFNAWKGNDGFAAGWFGLATALKANCGLFLPFLLWKRQWRLAILTTFAALFWIALPALWMGPESWWRHQQQWNTVALRSALGNPIPGAAENELRVQNQALRPAILSVASHWSADVRTSAMLADATMVLVFAVCCWAWRFPYQDPYKDQRDPRWPLESATVMLLVLLLSPVTWTQHLVMVIPTLFLIIAQGLGVGGLSRIGKSGLALFAVLALVLNRSVVGKSAYLTLLGYHIHTVAMLIMLALLLVYRPCVPSSQDHSEDHSEDHQLHS
jgi:hypothetical protein